MYYRPVALTSHLIKILEKILAKKYPPLPRNTSENEPQISNMASALADPASPSYRASQQDIRGIVKVKQC